jgi:tetratricopeptide (TPR) repeat protein
MASRSVTLKAMRASAEAQVPPRMGLRVVAVFLIVETLLLVALSILFPGTARAQAVLKGEISTSTDKGYARIVFTFQEDVEADVRLANGIIIIAFKRPIDVLADRLPQAAPDYISAARRDPDGSAVRIALRRKVTVNAMAAGRRYFVDLLPETWVGVQPGLPQDVVDELTRRAREAERKARMAQHLARLRQLPPVRVRLGTHPSFSRYVFELPETIQVAVDQAKETLTLLFDAPLGFDLADVKTTFPPGVASIGSETHEETAQIVLAFNRKVDIRTFREDGSFVVDIDNHGTATSREEPSGPASPRELPGLVLVRPDDKGAAPGRDPSSLREAPPTPSRAVPTPPIRPAAVPQAGPGGDAVPPVPQAVPPRAPVSEAKPPTGPPVELAAARPDSPPEPARAPEASTGPLDKPAAMAGAVASNAPAVVPAAPPMQGMSDDATEAPGVKPIVAELRRQGDTLRLMFPFPAPTPAAVFRRYDTLWLVFDSATPIDVAALLDDPSRLIRSAEVTRSREGQVVRIKLERPRMTSASVLGSAWTIALGDMVLDATAPLAITRAMVPPNRATTVIPFDEPRQVHHLADPDVGDTLLAVTALAPARGILRTQEFVEFRALATTHGVVIQPLADDVTVELVTDKILVGRPGGLVLSAVTAELAQDAQRSGDYRPVLIDSNQWGSDRQAPFTERQTHLTHAAAAAPEGKRTAARLDLARFYLGRELFPEAKSVLDVAVAEDRPSGQDPSGLVLRAVAHVMMNRTSEALADLADPAVGDHGDATLWRALALSRERKWAEARESFKDAEAAMRQLPIELQRHALQEQARAALEVGDFSDAARVLQDLDIIGVPLELAPNVAVLAGRVAQGLGRISDARAGYRQAARSSDRAAAAQGRLREVLLRYSLNEIARSDAVTELESLTTLWRGDETENEALHALARWYTEDQRYRDALDVMRTAQAVHPGSTWTRQLQLDAAATFEGLFLGGKADPMPPIEALSLFYDFRDLTPSGRRGDEMIRRLTDRLVAVDLLGQAAELLQHQIDHRLQGAARAQVAVRLAGIYLVNKKPDRALQVLRMTRAPDIGNDVRQQRLLLEARALSDTARPDLALEVVANLEGREVDRLRSDILWSARRWRESAEQIEKLYGERWREFAPLTDVERPDILRAAVGFTLSEDHLGLDRFREKYGPKMAEGPLARAFEVVTSPFAAGGVEFRGIAKSATSADTLEQFLRDLRTRYPDTAGVPPSAPAVAPAAVAPAAERPKRMPGLERSTSGSSAKASPQRTAAR